MGRMLGTLVVVSMVACNTSTTTPTPTPTTATGDTGAPTPDPIQMSGLLFVLTPEAPYAEGSDVCFVVDGVADPCTTVEADGTWRLDGVPAKTFGGLRYSGGQLATFYSLLQTPDRDHEVGTFSIDTPAVVQGYHDQTGLPRESDGAVVLVEMYPGAKPGWEARISPETGDGPFYYSTPFGHLDLSATGTLLPSAIGVFLNVDRAGGPYQTELTREGTACSPTLGDPLPAWTIPDDADIVYTGFVCDG